MKKLDNPYVVILTPREFHEIYESMDRELEDLDHDENDDSYKAHKKDVQDVVKALKLSDKMHVCMDEVD